MSTKTGLVNYAKNAISISDGIVRIFDGSGREIYGKIINDGLFCISISNSLITIEGYEIKPMYWKYLTANLPDYLYMDRYKKFNIRLSVGVVKFNVSYVDTDIIGAMHMVWANTWIRKTKRIRLAGFPTATIKTLISYGDLIKDKVAYINHPFYKKIPNDISGKVVKVLAISCHSTSKS